MTNCWTLFLEKFHVISKELMVYTRKIVQLLKLKNYNEPKIKIKKKSIFYFFIFN